jgi:hypothetical protein
MRVSSYKSFSTEAFYLDVAQAILYVWRKAFCMCGASYTALFYTSLSSASYTKCVAQALNYFYKCGESYTALLYTSLRSASYTICVAQSFIYVWRKAFYMCGAKLFICVAQSFLYVAQSFLYVWRNIYKKLLWSLG